MATKTIPEDVQRLLDKQAIAEVLYRYCRGCDRADEAALRDCFHPDATLRHGGFDGTAADFCSLAMKIVGPLRASKHVIGNVTVEFAGSDRDRAVCEAHYLAYHREVNRQSGLEEDVFQGGRYLDRFERRDGAWRIAQRLGLIDFERYEPPADRHLARLAPEMRGAKHLDDPWYRLFAPPEEKR